MTLSFQELLSKLKKCSNDEKKRTLTMLRDNVERIQEISEYNEFLVLFLPLAEEFLNDSSNKLYVSFI